jgi:hypothetical protein
VLLTDWSGHGRSRHPEIAKTIEKAKQAFEMDMVGALKNEAARAHRKA